MKKVYIHDAQNHHKKSLINQLIESAKGAPIEFTTQKRKADAIVILGGDGDFLHGARKTNFLTNVIYIGLSQNEEVGIYSSIPFSRHAEVWNQLSNPEHFHKHDLIHLSIDDRSERFYACLNELSIRSNIIKSIAIDILIDDQRFEQFHGDGLIISTPTGSSGYNKSIGGAVIDPKLTALQISKIAPLTNRRYQIFHSPLILDQSRKVTLKIIQDGNDHPTIGLDNEAFPISNTQSIELTIIPKALIHFSLPETNYIDQLKNQFLN